MDIWTKAGGEQHVRPVMATIHRMVESQEQAATLSLVSNVYEQGMLEELLESTKNPMPASTEDLHYLLKTPFRYPPLKYGSRFGATWENSLFYGSLNLETALAETAYYRFVYMLGPETPFCGTVASEYTSFSVAVRSKLAVFLDQPPFTEFDSELTSRSSYTHTQALGAAMRQSGVEVVQYISARDKARGKNMALFTPRAFSGKKPLQSTRWLCQTSIEEVGFVSAGGEKRMSFFQQEFMDETGFPSPAT